MQNPRFGQIGWGITRRCNLSCPHCYISAVKSSDDEFTTDECLRIIDELAALGVGGLSFTGGEPLVRKDLEELMVYAGRYGMQSKVTTNGVPLTPERVESLYEAGLRSVQVSLDGSTPERNHRIRKARVEDFRLIVDGVKRCLQKGMTVQMAMILTRATIDDVEDYVEMCRGLGVQSIRFCGFVPHGGGESEAVQRELDPLDRHGELAALAERLAEVEAPKIRFDAAVGPVPPSYRYHKCVAGVETFYIADNGDVYPCTSLHHDCFKVGNVRQRPLKEIASDPKMTEMASFDRDRIEGYCRDCDYFRVCRGACRGATYSRTGDLCASFPTCLYQVSTGLT